MAITPLQLGDITLDSETYKIDIASYRVRDIVDFAPRAAEPGGSIIHSELGLYQPYLKTDFRHGFGFMWEEDALGYLNTENELDTRHKGLIMMMTQSVDTGGVAAPMQGFTSVIGLGTTDDTTPLEYIMTWGSDGAQRAPSTGTQTWAAFETSDTLVNYTNEINYILETNNYIHIFPSIDSGVSDSWGRPIRILKSGNPVATDSGAQFQTGLDTAAENYQWAIMHEGRIFAGKAGMSQIHHTANENLSDLEGTVADPNVILIGGDLPIPRARTYLGKLLLGRHDGLFQVDMGAGSGGGGSARRILDFSSQTSANNFRFMEVYNNKLVFPIRDTIYMWNGATLSDITPPFLSDTFPFVTYGRFDNGVSVGRFLFITARTNESSYQEDILAWDGVGWHKLAEVLTSAGTGEITAMGYDVNNNYLWYSTDEGTDTVQYIQFQDLSEFPYANFATSGQHRYTSSRMGMGFRRVTKSSPSLIVEAAGSLSSTIYLEVHYQLDGGTIYEWGDSSGNTGNAAGHITSAGVTTLTNPEGTAAGQETIEYNYIQIIIDFVTDNSALSPILEGYTLRFIMRPATLYGHFFNIVAASNLKIGAAHRDLKSVRDIYSRIDTARASSAPISFLDPFGVSVSGYISSLERRAVERHGRETRRGFPNIESRILINFVEIG